MKQSNRSDKRIERDSLGSIEVPVERYWGAQTQRSIHNFSIGNEVMPTELLSALALVKRAAAAVNCRLGVLDKSIADVIITAADEVLAGHHSDEFPLVVWQTGSGTHTNMNMNEVLANRASELMGGKRGTKDLVHPNDHVNRSQSSNDTFPTAMNVAAVVALRGQLVPELEHLHEHLSIKSKQWKSLIKVGRTHLQDAIPLTLGQEFSAFAQQMEHGIARIRGVLPRISELVQGGTAVGTGANAPKKFDSEMIDEISKLTGYVFTVSANKFEGIGAHDAVVEASGSLNTLAVSLMKIANDIRLLGSGPHAGLGDLRLPANEPGSSIMPGKVNPTQSEALSQVCAQVMGNHLAITVAGAGGYLQLNVYKPVLIYNLLQSIRLLAGAVRSFTDKCVAGIEPNLNHLEKLITTSPMIVTALAPHIGYDKAALIITKAQSEGITIRKAALLLELVTEEDFDRWVSPENVLGPS